MIRGLAGFGLMVALAVPVAAQQAEAQPASHRAEKAVQGAQQVADELTLTRVLGTLKLTAAQVSRLAPVLEHAQTRLKELDLQEAAEVTRLRAAAEEARRLAATGRVSPERVEQQFAALAGTYGAKRRSLRAELVAVIRAHLTRALSQEQVGGLHQGIQTTRRQERAQMSALAAAAGQGGPATAMLGMLDRLRQIPADRWEQARERLASRPAFGAGADGPLGGLGGPEFLALVERVRAMSPEEFAASRGNIAAQLSAQAARQGQGSVPTDPREVEAQLDWFIERYLLHPAAPSALRRTVGR